MIRGSGATMLRTECNLCVHTISVDCPFWNTLLPAIIQDVGEACCTMEGKEELCQRWYLYITYGGDTNTTYAQCSGYISSYLRVEGRGLLI